MKKFLLFFSAAAIAATALAQEFQPNTEYYIRNVKTGMYLNGGHSWGAQTCVRPTGRAIELISTGEFTYNIKSSVGLVKDGPKEYWMDGEIGKDFFFDKQADGSYLIDCDGFYLYADEYKNYTDEDWPGIYQLILHRHDLYTVTSTADAYDKEEAKWEVLTREQMLSELATATAENPKEATFLIKAHCIDLKDSDNDAYWTMTNNGQKVANIYPDSGWGFDCNEWWNKATYLWFINDNGVAGVDGISQVANGAPKGQYEATLRAVNQDNTPLVVDINGSTGEVAPFSQSDLWYGSAVEVMNNDANLKTLKFNVADDGVINIQFKKTIDPAQQNRFAFKAITLKYLGASQNAGVENVAAEAINLDAPAEYYNMQGIRVEPTTTGLYIVKQGNKVAKQLIRK